MAFCSKCGAKLEDGTKFCATCGAVQDVQETAAPAQAAPEAAPAAEKKPIKVDNKMVGLIAAGVAAIVVIVLICAIGSALFGGGYKKPLKTIKKAFNSQTTDIDDYLDVLPKFVGNAYDDALSLVKDIDKDMVKDLNKEIEGGLEDFYDSAEEALGKKVKASYKITDKEKLDKDDCEDIAEIYADAVESIEDLIGIDITDAKDLEDLVENFEDELEDMDVSSKQIDKAIKLITNLAGDLADLKISKAYILEVEITFEGKEDEMEQELSVCVAKINGKWCIEPLTTYAEMAGEDAEDILGDLISELRYLMY